MEITGTVTANAVVNTTKNNKQVVNFSIAINERYKAKSGEINTITEYFRCAFWLGTNVAKILTKGTIVALSGRPFANAWIGADGEAKAAMNFNTNNIRIVYGGKRQASAEQAIDRDLEGINQDNKGDDDLPF